ncbi:MAG TPA: carbohydrate kinase [Gallionellaceae bacterium]|nr:carbohydrate kinase [Gallionellaceae bacterium]
MIQNLHFERLLSQRPVSGKTRGNTVELFGEVLADVFPDRTVLGGAPFNVAYHLKHFGQNPVLVSRLGHDALRDKVLETMEQTGMTTVGMQCDMSHPTGQVIVHIDETGHRFDILPQQAYDFIHPAVVRMTALSTHPVMIYYGTMAQRNETSRRALKSLLRSTDALKFLDVNLRAPWYDEETLRKSLQNADIAKLNDEELRELADIFGLPDGDPQDQARELLERFDLDQVVVTCGAAGAWRVGRDGATIQAGPASPVGQTVDTVGAGDGFAAVILLGRLLNWPAALAMERANAFAAAICGIRGAIPDDAGFYKPYTEGWNL